MVSLFAQAPQAVDLGLSVKWADRNLDAATQYDDGLPYQWGETTPKQKQFSPTDYFLPLVKLKENAFVLSKEHALMLTEHNRYTLRLEYDAAHVRLGGKWRMPTKEEIEELVEKCSFSWEAINKRRYLKVLGTNGQAILIPALGVKGINHYGDNVNTKKELNYRVICPSSSLILLAYYCKDKNPSYWKQYRNQPIWYEDDIFTLEDYYLKNKVPKPRCTDPYFNAHLNYVWFGFYIRPVYDDKVPDNPVSNGAIPTLTWLSSPATTSQRQVTVKVGVKSSSQITQTAVYVNGQQSRGAVVVKNDGYDMTISHTVTLTQGQNVIKVTAANASGTASEERTITYNDNSISKPTLTWILAPANTTQKQQTIKVGVKSKSPITQTAVYVNGQQSRGAVVVKNDGYDMTISHTVTLSQRQNIIKVTVANASGMASVERTVAYAQPNVPQPVPQPIAPVQREKRLALVIGNANYAGQALANPVNDATDMASKLRTLGFDVIFLTDGTKRNIEDKINEFGEKASHYDVAMFYYAGHGIQYNGSNYLIPIGANMKSKGDIEYECTDMGRVLTKMEESGCKMKIVALDACRNNPFERSWYRGAGQSGLSAVNAPVGTFISYATSPGSTAADGQDRNSPYTKALLLTLATPGLTIERVFKDVALKVFNSTNRQQTPWYSSSLFQGDFIFNNGKQ